MLKLKKIHKHPIRFIYFEVRHLGAPSFTRSWTSFFTLLLFIAIANPLMAQTENTTITTTTTTPVTPQAPAPVAVTQMVITTTTTEKNRTLYLRNGYRGVIKKDSQVFLRPNGRVYDGDSEYIGHLTNLDGDDLKKIPNDRRYKIRSLNGTPIASTTPSPAFDNDRTISLACEDMDGHLIIDTTTSTAPMVPVVTSNTTQSSTTTTTTTQSVPSGQNPP